MSKVPEGASAALADNVRAPTGAPIFSGYDFLDFGAGAGVSMRYAAEKFGGRGLGLDINPKKVEACRKAGFDSVQQDVSALDPDTMGRVRFVIMSHFLEHLPSYEIARKCIASACRVADEFVLMYQPYFDSDGYLFELGLKLYWSDWRIHSNHITMLQFQKAFVELPPTICKRFIIGRRLPIKDSTSDAVHSLNSPTAQARWQSDLHPPKPHVVFNYPVFTETFGIVLCTTDELPPKIEQFITLKGAEVVFDSRRTE